MVQISTKFCEVDLLAVALGPNLGMPVPFLVSRLILGSKLFVTQHGVDFLMLSSDTRLMGRFVDVVWYDLNGTGDRVGGIPNLT